MAVKEHKFIVSDETVNRYGYRILTDGISTKDFDNNPVVLYNHQRSSSYGNPEILPIGKVTKFERKGGQLIAFIVFDQEDEFAKRIESKVEQGILNATSVCHDPITWTEDPKQMLAGQTGPTVTATSLLEISITDIPANANAVKLFKRDNTSEYKLIEENKLNLFFNETNTLTMSKQLNAAAILLLLALPETGNEQEVLDAIAKLKTDNQKLSNDLKTQNLSKVDTLLDAAEASGKIKKGDTETRETYKKLATSDFDATKKILDAMAVPTKPQSLTNAAGSGNPIAVETTSLDDAKLFEKLSKENPKELERMQAEEPERFQLLYDAYTNKGK